MKKKNKERFKFAGISLISASIVGTLHYISHQIFTINPVPKVGLVVFVSVFIIAYLGMTRKK